MSEITGTSVGHEAYAFACMRCGHGWEQAYDIEHHIDASGHEFIVYRTDGERVPSPLSSPTCLNCGSHVVRIMRAGQVSSVRNLMERAAQEPRGKKMPESPPAGPIAQQPESVEPAEGAPREPHHWHLSDLLHPFQKK